MTSDLRQGFRLGRWKIEPLRGAVTGPHGEAHHLEPKVMDVLVFLAEHANEMVTRVELLEAVWRGHAAADELLTRAISELRHAFHDHRGDPKYIETVPKRGYRLIGDIRLSDGSRLEKKGAAGETTGYLSGRTRNFILIAVLTMAIAYFGYNKFVVEPAKEEVPEAARTLAEEATDTPEMSIAVLPFVNMSDDPGNEYFSDGISEELLNTLAQVPGLRVAARTSSFQFKGENRDVIDIGRQLNVAYILEGSVRKSDNDLRITVQLINADDGLHVMSRSYDRELDDIFAVQAEVSAAIVGSLREHLRLEVKSAPRVAAAANTEAHDAYLRGRYLVVQRTRTSVEGAVREFQRAVALDPDYALGHAELAMATLLLGTYTDLTFNEAGARAAPHAERAMALDPALAEAHAATGYLLSLQNHPDEAVTHFQHAIQINPNYSIVYVWMGNLLEIDLGQYGEAFQMHEKSLRLDPLSIPAIANYADDLIERNRLAEAHRELQKLAAIAPRIYEAVRTNLTSLDGKWANAVLGKLNALQIDLQRGQSRRSLASAFAVIGLEKEALAVSEDPLPVVLTLLSRPRDAVATAEARLAENPNSVSARRDLGLALAGAGDYARARPILEEMWRQSGGRVTGQGLFRTHCAAALVAIRRTAGKDAEVDELMAAMRDNVRRYQEAGITAVVEPALGDKVDYARGLAAFLGGEREKGLALLAKGAEDGFFIPQKEAYLQVLYDDPGFAPILASQEARQVHERKRFLDIVCADNPYADFWQPAEGTCERFATAGGD